MEERVRQATLRRCSSGCPSHRLYVPEIPGWPCRPKTNPVPGANAGAEIPGALWDPTSGLSGGGKAHTPTCDEDSPHISCPQDQASDQECVSPGGSTHTSSAWSTVERRSLLTDKPGAVGSTLRTGTDMDQRRGHGCWRGALWINLSSDILRKEILNGQRRRPRLLARTTMARRRKDTATRSRMEEGADCHGL